MSDLFTASLIPVKPKTKRADIACDLCHAKKVRCDGRDPCSHCARLNRVCTYDRPSQRKRKPKESIPKLAIKELPGSSKDSSMLVSPTSKYASFILQSMSGKTKQSLVLTSPTSYINQQLITYFYDDVLSNTYICGYSREQLNSALSKSNFPQTFLLNALYALSSVFAATRGNMYISPDIHQMYLSRAQELATTINSNASKSIEHAFGYILLSQCLLLHADYQTSWTYHASAVKILRNCNVQQHIESSEFDDIHFHLLYGGIYGLWISCFITDRYLASCLNYAVLIEDTEVTCLSQGVTFADALYQRDIELLLSGSSQKRDFDGVELLALSMCLYENACNLANNENNMSADRKAEARIVLDSKTKRLTEVLEYTTTTNFNIFHAKLLCYSSVIIFHYPGCYFGEIRRSEHPIISGMAFDSADKLWLVINMEGNVHLHPYLTYFSILPLFHAAMAYIVQITRQNGDPGVYNAGSRIEHIHKMVQRLAIGWNSNVNIFNTLDILMAKYLVKKQDIDILSELGDPMLSPTKERKDSMTSLDLNPIESLLGSSTFPAMNNDSFIF